MAPADCGLKKARKGSFSCLVRWDCWGGTRNFCPALAALVGLAQNIFSSPYTIPMPSSPSPSKLGWQPCWVACPSMSLWSGENPGFSSICIILFLVRPTVRKAPPVEGLHYTYSTRVSVPSSDLAPSAPSPASECVPPPLKPKGGGDNTRLRVRGRGEPILTT